MNENPYAAPKAAIDRAAVGATGAVSLYSPTQVACGALLGGPVGLIHFLRANFSALDNGRGASMTLVLGIVLIVALIVILPLLPENFPSSPFSILYIIVGRFVAEKHQMTKQAIAGSERFAFHSNWRVVGVGLLCLLASAAVIMLPLMLLLASSGT